MNERCPKEVLAFVQKVEEAAGGALHLKINLNDFAKIRQFAPHRIVLEVDQKLIRQKILASVPTMRDGKPSSTHLSFGRDVPHGSIRVVA